MKAGQVLITGCGIVCAIGNDKGQVLESLLAGRTGVGPLKYLKTGHTEFPVGEVKMSDTEMERAMGIAPGTPTTRTALMGMMAMHEALGQACLEKDDLPHVGFVDGTTVGGMDKSEQYYLDFIDNDSRNAYIGTHDCGSCSEMIADRFGRFKFITTISTACSSAANAIELAADMIRLGEADVVVAGGSECITKFHLNGFNSLMILDHGQCRPFDAGRAGLNLGEGAAFVVLESAESAAKRGVKPVAMLSGYGNACDAFHQTASSPDGEGAYLAMMKALDNAGLKPSDIDYINAHGTGTPNNDLSESQAMKRVFGDVMPQVSSTKSLTGHTTSASGSIEAVICILALQNGFTPVNYAFEQADEGVIVPNMKLAPDRELKHVLCNSFGFGGNDSSLVISNVSNN
ncbi:MAG: beta-ketoacyl-[acyl-carrier-protein] synthase family protein [Bacteroidaceae bacterium]|nr:beta-ketoacyl-[acyl-carrier-protein] synthase family protein [Bacteroidaceae bacterium]